MLVPILLAGTLLKKRVGDQPNVPIRIRKHHRSWVTVQKNEKYSLQIHADHGRILNHAQIQIAWGGKSAMLDKYARLNAESFLIPGDVIGISRGMYYHYGVYIGNEEVIHLAGEGKIKSGNVKIHQIALRDFLPVSGEYFVLHFPQNGKAPEKIYPNSSFLKRKSEGRGICDFLFHQKYTVFSPQETIERAKSRLGEVGYHLTRSNCEHFALWCKTGIKQSRQVDDFIGELLGI